LQKPDILFRQEPDTFQEKFRYFSVLYNSVYYHAAGQIVVSRRAFGMVEPRAEGNSLEELHLKEFNRPVLAVEILRWREETEKVEVAAAEAPRRRQPS
jgi:hypothetical protein